MEMLLLLLLFIGDNGGLDGDVAGNVAGDLNKKTIFLFVSKKDFYGIPNQGYWEKSEKIENSENRVLSSH